MGHSAANCYLKKYEVPDTPYDHPLQPVLVIYGPSGIVLSLKSHL